MGKVKGKHRLDKYCRLAKERGFRSRASYKLLQLDAKYSLLHSSHAVLDLCAAPGGWIQVAVEKVPVGSLVLGIDLVSIPSIRGAVTIKQDITKTSECRSEIKHVMEKHGVRAFDLVLHDGSPNLGGAWDQEAVVQNALVIDSLKLATEFLAPEGNFVTKVFRSRDYESLRFCLEKFFDKVEVFKPTASRLTSAEIYLVGLNYKGSNKIDRRLLDFRHVFKETVEPKRKFVDVLGSRVQKRNRGGYEEGDTVLRRVVSASDFIWSSDKNPLEILGSVSSISFDDQASLPLKEHDLTTDEIKILCDDLGVLGKNDFKHILKWRIQISKALSPLAKKEVMKKEEDKDDDDDKLLNELEELTNLVDRKKKRAKKVLAKRRVKDKVRKESGSEIDGYVDNELFSLLAIKGKKDLMVVEDDHNGKDSESEEEERGEGDLESDLDSDSDEERQRYIDQMEEMFDKAYEWYMVKKEGNAKQRKRAKHAHAEKLEDSDEDEEMMKLDEANPLVVSLDDGEEQTQEEISNQWFSQDIFAQALEEDEALLSDKSLRKSKKEDDFATQETDDDDDVDTKAEILACAKKMLKKKKYMIEDAYNKNMFESEGSLPKWFLDDEKKHRKPMKPITKEEVNAMKAKFKEINARPAKKVVEAKARKKRAAMKRLEKVRKKANTISDTTDISERSKSKMIDKLYRKAVVGLRKGKKELVVCKKGVGVKVGKGQMRVDKRMKSDARKRGGGKPRRNGQKKAT